MCRYGRLKYGQSNFEVISEPDTFTDTHSVSDAGASSELGADA
jgi:hypothetical protein